MQGIFTSESVSKGHPDRVADQISEAILDACLAQDKFSRVAVGCLCTTDHVTIAGEVSTSARIDYDKLVRRVVHDIGYTSPELGFCSNTLSVTNLIHEQSPDISMGIQKADGCIGCGDQGIFFGGACNDTAALMPLPIYLARRLTDKFTELRESGYFGWARPDAKSQVSVVYENDIPKLVDTVVMAVQHDPDISTSEVERRVKEHVVIPVLAEEGYAAQKILVNQTGKFVLGGPAGDTGVTGRKLMVDTYGGYYRHGGGNFNGKDPTKVDRTFAYGARYLAKNIVAAGVCNSCEIQLSSCIGVAEPISM